MKLIVQIPCFNEEKTLPQTVRDIPRTIEGIDTVELLIIDDGSSDQTVAVARELGVEHIVRLKINKGLSRAFMAGLDACIKLGADIIVNTDGDNQYQGEEIRRLIKPIVDGQFDIVVGDRQVDTIEHFSPIKKKLQKFGSFVVRQLSETDVIDTTSGFRAYSREAALQMNILSPYTYTLESIIQAGKKHLAITHIPVATNPPTRKSRLFTTIPKYIRRQLTTIVRMYTMYQPLRVFFYCGLILTGLGCLGLLRFLYFYVTGDGNGHIQSIIVSGMFVIIGFMTFMLALIADIISFNRRLIEDTLLRVRKIEPEIVKEDDFSQPY